ncbi:MAG: SIMPL domain-containing protein [bacterium]
MEEKKENCECNKDCKCGEKCFCICKKYHKYKKIFALIIIIILIFHIIDTYENGKKIDTQKDTINVNGKSEIIVKPDIANISFSVKEENMDIAKAVDIVNKKIVKIIENLKTNGVNEKDIKTTGYNIEPKYDYIKTQSYPYNGKQVLVGYNVIQNIEIKIKDLSKVGKIVADLGTLGITGMNNLNFTNDKYDDLEKQARDEAIIQARSEANKLAKALGIKLKNIVGYSEGILPPPYLSKNFYDMEVSAMDITPAVLPTGENKIISNISITYEIE